MGARATKEYDSPLKKFNREIIYKELKLN